MSLSASLAQRLRSRDSIIYSQRGPYHRGVVSPQICDPLTVRRFVNRPAEQTPSRLYMLSTRRAKSIRIHIRIYFNIFNSFAWINMNTLQIKWTENIFVSAGSQHLQLSRHPGFPPVAAPATLTRENSTGEPRFGTGIWRPLYTLDAQK